MGLDAELKEILKRFEQTLERLEKQGIFSVEKTSGKLPMVVQNA